MKTKLLLSVALLATMFMVSSVAISSQKSQARVEPYFSIQIKTNAGNNNREQYGLFIQQDLAKIGIAVELMYQEWGVFFDDIYSGHHQTFILGWYGGTDPDWRDAERWNDTHCGI